MNLSVVIPAYNEAGNIRSTIAELLSAVTRIPDIKDVQVTLLADETRASTRFRANGTVSFEKTNAGHQPSRWELKWQREGSDWKIIEVHRLHPLKDEELGMFSGN